MEKIDLILKFYSKDAFVKIKSYDHCIIGIDVQSKRLIYSVNLFIETLINENNHYSMMNIFIKKFIDSDPQLYGFQISTSDFLDYFKPVIEELKLSDPSYAWEKCSEETKENLNF